MAAAVPIRFACSLYDRMLALHTGEVKPEGIDLTFLSFFSPRPIFDRMARELAFDAAEFSFSEFASRLAAGDRSLVAIPVFPSRAFRHGMIAVNRNKGIDTPRDLEGKRVGVPLYTMSAAVWTRGILEREYGVDLGRITWVEGATNAAGQHGDPDLVPMRLDARIERKGAGQTLNQLLIDGEIDATIGTSPPEAIATHDHVQRLFPDYRWEERDYYRRTGIFPIMHLLALRRDVYERHPFIAASLFRAFTQAKDAALKRMHYLGAPVSMQPWLTADVDEIDALFGGDPYPYGVAPNRAALEAMTEFLARQGITARKLAIEELFVPVEA